MQGVLRLRMIVSDDHASLRMTRRSRLVQGFGFEGYVGFAGGFFLGVFFHPGFPAFAGGGVASGEGQGGDFGVGDRDFFV